MGLKRKTSLLASALMLSANFLMPASTFAAGTGTGGLSFYDYLAVNADKDTVIDFNEAPATGNVVEHIDALGADVTMSDIGGLYMLQSTKDDEKPVYFYRGSVEDNNVILNDMCWLIVRTTETGGTKLLYNGTPTDGQCLGDPDWTVDKTLTALSQMYSGSLSEWPKTNIGASQFNANYNSPSDMYYMYGERYEAENKNYTSGTVFGNDAVYAHGVYTLQDTVAVTDSASAATAANGHHYTCLTTGTTCSQVYYATYQRSSFYDGGDIMALTLTGGDTIETALAKMQANTNSSKAKQTVDAWYEQNMTGVTDLLEDTPFNGQKAFGSGTLYSKNVDSASTYDDYNYTKEIIDTMFSGVTRENNGVLPLIRDFSPNAIVRPTYSDTDTIVAGETDGETTAAADEEQPTDSRIDYNISELGFNSNPTVGCPNKADCYTVDSANGNGALTYPVGLLTNSEMIMAGASGSMNFVKGQYIDDNFVWWGVSPFNFEDYDAYAGAFVGYVGFAVGYDADRAVGVRPVVSLKSTLGAFDGDGSRENPFTALAEVSGSEDEEDEAPAEGETVPTNPQTSDVATKAITIAAIGLAPIFILRKQLTKRAN